MFKRWKCQVLGLTCIVSDVSGAFIPPPVLVLVITASSMELQPHISVVSTSEMEAHAKLTARLSSRARLKGSFITSP